MPALSFRESAMRYEGALFTNIPRKVLVGLWVRSPVGMTRRLIAWKRWERKQPRILTADDH